MLRMDSNLLRAELLIPRVASLFLKQMMKGTPQLDICSPSFVGLLPIPEWSFYGIVATTVEFLWVTIVKVKFWFVRVVTLVFVKLVVQNTNGPCTVTVTSMPLTITVPDCPSQVLGFTT